MTIIVSEKGRHARRLERRTIRHEDYLQRYIYENPEAIPLDEYKPGARLLILAREFPTGSGAIDALGVDQDGELYLIETKLEAGSFRFVVLMDRLEPRLKDLIAFINRNCRFDVFGVELDF